VPHEGWIGYADQMMHYLAVVHADRDEGGRFIVRGTISTYMGAGEEAVIGGDAEYRVGGPEGRWCNLAAGLRGTSYGHGVLVI